MLASAKLLAIDNSIRCRVGWGNLNEEKISTFADNYLDNYRDLLDKENLKRGASIQKKYDQLNPVHQNIINETIDAYLCKENKGTIIS